MKNKVTCEVQIASKIVSGVLNVELNQSLDDAHSFSIYLKQSVFLKDQPYDFLNKSISDQFLSQEVFISFMHDTGDEVSFKGIVTRVVMQTSKDLDHYVLFEGEGMPVFLDGPRTRRTFVDKTLKEIVDQVKSKSNLPVSMEVSPVFGEKIPFVMQYDESIFQFLRRLAYDFGEWFYYDGNTIFFGKRDTPDESAQYTINGDQVASREAAMFAVGTDTWNYCDAENKMLASNKPTEDAIFQDAGKSAVTSADNIYSANHFSPNRPALMDLSNQSDVDNMAENYSQQHTIYLDSVSGQMFLPGLYPTAEVKINLHYPPQTRDSKEDIRQDVGDFMVTSVRHQYESNGDYRAMFRAVSANLKVQPFSTEPPKPRVNNELAVVEDNQDENGSGRIKCAFLWSDFAKEDCKTNWVRLMSPYTAKGDGFIWLPEKEAQVMIGFYQGSTYRPYIIGSLYHGKHESEIGHSPDDNYQKQFLTAAGNQVLFDDTKGKESVLITNINKKDDFFKISFDDDKITLNCQGDIDIMAKQNINMEADNISIKAASKLNISAGQEAELSTSNLKVSADTKADITSGGSMKINSSAPAEVSSGAVLTIKGSMVKIN